MENNIMKETEKKSELIPLRTKPSNIAKVERIKKAIGHSKNAIMERAMEIGLEIIEKEIIEKELGL